METPSQVLLHTICLEPARWTKQKVSQPLASLLPEMAAAGFSVLEIFEPHLVTADSVEILQLCQHLQITPLVLSSYLNFNPLIQSEAAFQSDLQRVLKWIALYDFKKIRLFPGAGMKPADTDAIAQLVARLSDFARRISQVEVLLETHDGSLADDPALLVSIVEKINLPNVGLLYQPTVFTAESATAQLQLQKPWIRHVHLQNRNPDMSFSRLAQGVIPWEQLLSDLPQTTPLTLEFVPAGICPVETFDLALTLRQAQEEVAWVANIRTKTSLE